MSSWWDDITEKVSSQSVDLVDAYAEREVESISHEPDNTANMPQQNATASGMKYNATAATNAVQNQATAASAATSNFMDKYGKWLAIGGGTVAVLGVLIVATKGGK